MRIPRMLPWAARKAGIAEARAQALWADALEYAARKTGEVEGSQHAQAALAKFLELVEAEKSASLRQPREDARRPSLSSAQDFPTSRQTAGAKCYLLSDFF